LELQFGGVALYSKVLGKFGEVLSDDIDLEAVTEGIEHVTVHLCAFHYIGIFQDHQLRFLAFHTYLVGLKIVSHMLL
jgi:hypothetical protein